MQVHEFDPEIYPYKLWVVISKTSEPIMEMFKEYSGDDIIFKESFINSSRALTLPVIKKDTLKYGVLLHIKSKKYLTYEVVAHESSHAAKYLFEHIGASVSEHEPFEYVVGWVAKCCEQVKKFKKIEIM